MVLPVSLGSEVVEYFRWICFLFGWLARLNLSDVMMLAE